MEGLTCLWAYEGIARKLITQSKYKFYYDYLREFSIFNFQFSIRSELEYLRRFLETKPVVVPVPLWPKRERERGFNQAEVIAKLVAGRWKLEIKNLLVRTRDTGRQVGRTREERLSNIANAFEINPKPETRLSDGQVLRSKQIQNFNYQIPNNALLVDDVWTTGATMNECAKVLRQAGVNKVWGLVLAR